MNEAVKKELDREEHTQFHSDLLDKCKTLVKTSRDKMSEFYEVWDERQRVYDSERLPDKQDKKSQKHGEPVKMVIPITYAQVNTFIAFCMMLFKQRPKFYELDPQSFDDHNIQSTCEQLLSKDLADNKFMGVLYQFLLDIGKFGLGVIKHGWETKVDFITEIEEVPGRTVFGVPVTKGKQIASRRQITRREGNKIMSVSPYRFFPDTRLPLTRLQEGEFCASEDEYGRHALRAMEASGDVAGIKHVKNFSQTDIDTRSSSRFTHIKLDSSAKGSGMVCVTEVQVKLIPSEYELSDGTKLGDEDYPITYVVWYANDQRVIKCEPMNYLHGEFTFDAAQFTPDMHKLINKSLAEVIDKLQSTSDWFINARIAAVTRTIDNQLVIDPSGIDVETVENRSRVILMKPGASRTGVEKYLQQLNVVDSTTGHMNDVRALGDMINVVTGVNDNAMGQYHTGRRSASESRVVTQGAASRLVTICSLIWEGALAPLGMKLLTNLRQGMTEEFFTAVVGTQAQGMSSTELYPMFKATPEQLARQTDLFVFDGTLPSEKMFLAQTLQELLGLLLQNPMASLQFDISPNKLLRDIYMLRGVTGQERFALQNNPEDAQRMLALMQLQNQPDGRPEQGTEPPA